MNEQVALDIISNQHEDTRIRCPMCADGRKKSKEQTLSITIDGEENVFKCHHCDWSGVVTNSFTAAMRQEVRPKKEKVARIPTQLATDAGLITSFFEGRGVDLPDVSVLPPMVTAKKYFNQFGEQECVGFVYGNEEEPEAIKWRCVSKKAFTQTGAARSFYGLGQLDPEAKTVLIVEGEADVVALASIGIKAIGWPNGAPVKVSDRQIDKNNDGKYSCVWDSRELLERAEKILVATDQDGPGDALAEELARRIGRAKCYRVKYPEGCKDITDVLAGHDRKMVFDCIAGAKEFPLSGVYTVKSYMEQVKEAYRDGLGKGESTGFESVDELYTVAPGMLTIVTGLPSSGKSEFIDQIMVNLAKDHDWRFAIASFENPPHIHIAKLTEKLAGRPFFKGPSERVSEVELEVTAEFLDEHFLFLESKDGNLSTISSIIERTKQAYMRSGKEKKFGLVIDPYNYLEQERDKNEHQSITDMLTQIKAFCMAYNIHVWFVAHPAKMQARDDGSYPIPKGMNISGSAAWFAKTDHGLTVHRSEQGVEIHSWKSRFKWLGQQGMTVLDYEIPSGRYSEKIELWSGGSKIKSSNTFSRKPDWMSDIDEDDMDF